MYNVVFVDDEVDLCEIYEEMFTSKNISIKCFSDPEEAIKYINSNSVSMAIIDYRMPKLNGAELRKKISADLPCFLITGEFLNQEIDGFIGIIEKPLTQEVFETLLESHGNSIDKNNTELTPYSVLFKHMLQEVHIWKVVRGSDGKIKTWKLVNANPKALEMWGKTLNDVVGKTTDEIFPHSNPVPLFLPIVEEIFETGEPVSWRKNFKDTNQLLEMISIPCGDYFISTNAPASPEEE